MEKHGGVFYWNKKKILHLVFVFLSLITSYLNILNSAVL